ncbi:nucleotidyltransferase domain-containing protein [Actinocorallia lasiicapitis]
MTVVVGSTAYGLSTDASDVDRRGVFLAPTEAFWRFTKPPTHLDGPRDEEFSWELERFCVLALDANPTVLECLWSPLVEHSTPVGDELRALAPAFLSRQAHRTFLRYADRQFQRARTAETIKWKHVMHLLRLLISGRHLVTTGEPLVDVSAHRDHLLSVRRGEVPWPEIAAWRATLTADLETALATSPLPPHPDHETIERFLVTTRRNAL